MTRTGYTWAPDFLDGIPARFYQVHDGMIHSANPDRNPYITVPLLESVVVGFAAVSAEPEPSSHVTIGFMRQRHPTERIQRWRLFPATERDRKAIADWMARNHERDLC